MKNIIMIFIGIIIGFITYNSFFVKKDKIESSESFNGRDPKELYQEQKLINHIIETGDSIEFERLRSKYHMNRHPIDLLGIALLMANKYDNTQAHSDVFECVHLTLNYNRNNDTLFNYNNYDKKTKKMVLENLEIALKRNNINAKELNCQYDPNVALRDVP